jgi:hypothetical protein
MICTLDPLEDKGAGDSRYVAVELLELNTGA